MKTRFFNTMITGIPAAVAIVVFMLFGSLRDPGEKKDASPKAVTQCCSGYTIGMKGLRKFMLDSLIGNQFEGGVYSRADLLSAINATPGDSIYLINTLINCQLGKGTDLALTSRTSSGVNFVRGKNCRPCPPRACCPQKVCVITIVRSCASSARTEEQPGDASTQ